jgi:hypothetical protein
MLCPFPFWAQIYSRALFHKIYMIRQLLDELMGMVIKVSINEVSVKCVKHVRKVKVLRNGR